MKTHWWEEQPVKLHHQSLPSKKKFKLQTCVGKVMASIFRENEGISLVEFYVRCHNKLWVICADILLKQQIQRVEPNRRTNEVLLLPDNAGLHTSLRTKEATATMGWTVLPHPTYSPDLAPHNFHLFVPLKGSLQGHCFADSNELEHGVCEGLWCVRKEFYVTGIQHLMQRWKKCIDNEGDLVE